MRLFEELRILLTLSSVEMPGMTTARPSLFNSSSSELYLITQGAEALVYRTSFLTQGQETALKYRPKKSYRHPTLDARLTKARILAEARVLVRCRKEGLRVPAVLGLDWEDGWLATEWIDGQTVRVVLDKWLRKVDSEAAQPTEESLASVEGVITGAAQQQLSDLMVRIGESVGRLHDIGVVHGDLTTSNLMLGTVREQQEQCADRRTLEGEVVLIDFGLAVQTAQDEDRAVDLYVLERAFGSTHPQAGGLFQEVLTAYGKSYNGANIVLKRLEEVRLRGRKKAMVG